MGQGYSLAALPAGSANIDVPELADLTYEKSLGNGRLMKCVRAMRKDGLVIAKIVMKPYASFTLGKIVKQLQAERTALAGVPNALSYYRIIETSTCGFVVRQYIYSSLYDRMSTRPFLDDIEKKWISYQLLCAVRDCHAKNIYHGDIKTENLLVTSWNWLYLCDFSSSFKPTYLPEDNPADFSFFFDTAGRRTCYLAPERFLLPGQDAQGKSPINWAMDMFSVGCVIAELFLERPIFTLSQLFKYRANKEYDPVRLQLSRINDENVREMISHLIELDPQDRYSAEETLNFSRGKVFPDYFQTFLHQYMHLITDPTSGRQPITTSSENLGEADERIERVYYDFDKISYFLEYDNPKLSQRPRLDNHLFPLQVDIPGYRHEVAAKGSSTVDDGTLIFLALVTSQLQRTARAAARVKACELLLAFAERTTDEAKLDRILPLLVALLSDKTERVKVAALRALTQVLALVKVVTPINANIFYDYLLPRLEPFVLSFKSKPTPWVRATYASCLGSLAMTASRYFDMVQALRADGTVPSTDPETEDGVMTASVFESYDIVRQAVVHQVVNQTKVILTDDDIMVRRAFLTSISPLCIFFGSSEASDLLLSHLNTYLNDKSWLLRCDFFETIIGVATFTGTASFEEFMLPLMVQALTDAEETVVERVLRSLGTIAGLGLVQRVRVWELIDIIGRFLIHPNPWIREAAASFMESSSRYMSLADRHCIALPLLRPYLKISPTSFDTTTLLQCVNKPFPRACLAMASDWATKTENGIFWKPVQRPKIFSFHHSDNVVLTTSGRDLDQQSFDKSPKNDEDEMWLKRLRNFGMAKEDEVKLLALREYIFRVAHRSKSNSTNVDSGNLNGIVSLSGLEIAPQTVFFDQDEDLFRYNRTQKQLRTGEPRTISEALQDAQQENAGNVHTGGVDARRQSLQVQSPDNLHPTSRDDESIHSDTTGLGQHHHGLRRKSSAIGLIGRTDTGKAAAAEISTTPTNAVGTMGVGSAQSKVPKRDPNRKSVNNGQAPGSKVASQRIAHTYAGHDPSVLNLLESLYMDNYPSDNLDFGPRVDGPARIPMQRANGSSPVGGWTPEGHMIAMLAEHTASVNRIVVAPDHSFFISGSDDGSVKVWNTARLEKHVSYRARRSHQHAPGVRVTSLCFMENLYCFVSTGSDGSVHVVRVDPGDTARSANLRLVRDFMLPDNQHAVWSEHYKSEVQSVLVLATNKSRIIGFELRTMQVIFDLANPLHHGAPTCFCMDRKHHWLLLGTTHGVLDLWDLRFKLRIKSWVFQGGSQIHRMDLTRRNRVTIAGGTNTGEITTWEIEKAGLREVYRVANHAPKESDKFPKLLELDDEGPGSMLRRFKGTSAVSIDSNNSGSRSTDMDRGVQAIAIGSHYTGDQDRVRHHFVVSAGPDRKVRFWDSRENSLCMVVNGLEPDETKPSFHRSIPLGADLIVLTERVDGDRDADGGSLSGPARSSGGKPSISSRKSSTRQLQRSSMISLQQKHLLQSHLDLIEDVAILESPYGMIVSADRSGVIYVFA